MKDYYQFFAFFNTVEELNWTCRPRNKRTRREKNKTEPSGTKS